MMKTGESRQFVFWNEKSCPNPNVMREYKKEAVCVRVKLRNNGPMIEILP